MLIRSAIGVLALLIATLIILSALELLPGDVATEKLGQSATPETVAAFREQLGLNDPAPVRYWNWCTGRRFRVCIGNTTPNRGPHLNPSNQHVLSCRICRGHCLAAPGSVRRPVSIASKLSL